MKFPGKLPGDLFGGVTAAVVMLPMALAFGVASGLGAAAGIYGAVAVGFFAAVFGGTPSQISGPTGPMTVAMAAIVTLHADSLSSAITIVMLAGLIQIALGLLRVGSFVSYTPYSVISGFMTGIGVIIITLQVKPLLGAVPVSGGPISQVESWRIAFANPSLHDLAAGLLALAICFLWPRRIGKFLPAPLVALVVGTVVAILVFTEARTIGAIPQGMPTFHLPLLEWGSIGALVKPAFILGLLGSIDSLLTSLVADAQTRTRHKPNRELVGQGIGNLAAGVLGALPGAGATTGTVTNIRAGGRTPLAGVLAAALPLALLLGLARIAEPIPLSVLAGILIKVGWDIIDWRFVTRIRSIRREYVFTMLVTLSMTVFIDLITAVALGLIVASVIRARDMERHEMQNVVAVPLVDPAFVQDLESADPDRLPAGLVRLKGRFSVGSANDLARAVAADIEDHDVVILDFSATTDVDDSAALAIGDLVQTAVEQDTDLIVVGLSGDVARILHSLAVFRLVPEERMVEELAEAKRSARQLLDDRKGAKT